MDFAARLDPELQALVGGVPVDSLFFVATTPDEIPRMRDEPRPTAAGPLSDRVERTDHVVPGDPPLTVRVHRPVEASMTPLPAVVSMHGGGYIIGNVDDDGARSGRGRPAGRCWDVDLAASDEIGGPESCRLRSVTLVSFVQTRSTAQASVVESSCELGADQHR